MTEYQRTQEHIKGEGKYTKSLSNNKKMSDINLVSAQDLPGKISYWIGSGKYARSTIIWSTIMLCFAACILFFIFSIICVVLFEGEAGILLKNIKPIPIITLALGYFFGKHEN
ncbi:MAG: hypothetical protein JRE64_28150 [Deltaproteobacteria bacterium]|nr:hypothetical protein [Deltaproteobacteria bacterium]